MSTENDNKLAEVERLAADFHDIYQQEAKRQGDVRHGDAYADLPENIKEFDRVLARHVSGLLDAAHAAALRAVANKFRQMQVARQNLDPHDYPGQDMNTVAFEIIFQQFANLTPERARLERALEVVRAINEAVTHGAQASMTKKLVADLEAKLASLEAK